MPRARSSNKAALNERTSWKKRKKKKNQGTHSSARHRYWPGSSSPCQSLAYFPLFFFLSFILPSRSPIHACPRYLFSALLSVPFPPLFAISLNPPPVYTALVCRLAVEILADLSQRDCNAAFQQFFLQTRNARAKCVNVLKNVKILPPGITAQGITFNFYFFHTYFLRLESDYIYIYIFVHLFVISTYLNQIINHRYERLPNTNYANPSLPVSLLIRHQGRDYRSKCRLIGPRIHEY